LLCALTAAGQDIDATLAVSSSSPATLQVKGRFVSLPARNLSLIRDYAGVSGLADRILGLRLENSRGESVAFKQLIPGEIVAEAEFTSWSFNIDLTPKTSQRALGHTSWIGTETGLIFFRDVLPMVRDGSKGNISFELPSGWTTSNGTKTFSVTDVDRSAVAIGKDLRRVEVSVSDVRLCIVTTEQWRFEDKRIADFSVEILRAYDRRIGNLSNKSFQILYIPFPKPLSAGTWEADTRGDTVVIVSSDMPFETQSIQRLHEQLRHELFHLWFPNSVSLTGNYVWFFEGFALYESLKLGVELNRLRFDDYLDTLGRAMTIDSMRSQNRSLIDASRSRTLEDTSVYARGMLAAFITDIELLQSSRGKEDVTSLLRNIYKKYPLSQPSIDGNTAILDEIRSPSVVRFVKGDEQPNWADIVRPIGIEVTTQPGVTDLKVSDRLTSSQKKLLDKLGYNNWRRSTVVPR